MNQINENIFFNKRNGRYIEIGAGNGSATEYFEKNLGWTGILVEPNPVLNERLRMRRCNSTVHLFPISTEPVVYFHSYYEQSANMSAIEETVPNDIAIVYYNDEIILNEKKTVDLLETKRLTDIIKDFYDFMVIDVNGHDIEVLRTWDFSYLIPIIIVKNPNCGSILSSHKYLLVDTVKIDDELYQVWQREQNRICVIS